MELLRESARQFHAEPRYDLAEEPWIEVGYNDGTNATIGLRQLLLDAHQITDLAGESPIERAGMRRFLEALFADLIRTTTGKNQHYWSSILEENAPLPPEMVEQILARHRDHLYLAHPETPFFQSHELIGRAVGETPEYNLDPGAPQPSSSAWFQNPVDHPLVGSTPAQAARHLVAQHFYALPGNGYGERDPGSAGSSSYAQGPGAIFSKVGAPCLITQVWRIDPRSLLCTVLANLSPEIVEPGDKGPAWMSGGKLDATVTDLLYRLTSSPISTVIADGDDEHIRTVLRGNHGLLRPGRPQANELMKEIVVNDQHSLFRFEQEPGKQREAKRITLPPDVVWSEMFLSLYGETTAATRGLGVTDPEHVWLGDLRLPAFLEFLVVFLRGTSTNRVLGEVRTFSIGDDRLSPKRQPKLESIAAAASALANIEHGVKSRVRYATKVLFAPNKDRDESTAFEKHFAAAVSRRWYLMLDDELDAVLRGERAVEGFLDRGWQLGRLAFSEAASPYLTSPSLSAVFPRARALIRKA